MTEPHNPQDEIMAVLVSARDALLHADSMLSLIRHRGGIKTWGTMGMAQEYEADGVIAETRRAWDSMVRLLSKGKERVASKPGEPQLERIAKDLAECIGYTGDAYEQALKILREEFGGEGVTKPGEPADQEKK